MDNSFLRYLLKNDAITGLSKTGFTIRKIINPFIRFAIPFTTKTKLIIVRRETVPKNRPIIFAATHGFKEDIVDTLVIINRQAYILIGSLSQIFYTIEGVSAWAAGTILVDRLNKESRKASKEKMIRALNIGASIIIFPEGTWNKSPNQMASGLFPGVYDVAKATGALVVPVATHRDGKHVYGILDHAFDITEYERKEGVAVLRDRFATLRYEMMDKFSHIKRNTLPFGTQADLYWTQYIDDLMHEVEFYDYEDGLHTKYIDKTITEPAEAFAHLQMLQPNLNNAFLFRNKE